MRTISRYLLGFLLVLAALLPGMAALLPGMALADGSKGDEEANVAAQYMTNEESYEFMRQQGASEEVIETIKELNRTFDELHARNAPRSEADAVVEKFNQRLQDLQKEKQGDGFFLGWGYSTDGIYATCAPWARAFSIFSVDRGNWYSTFYAVGGSNYVSQGYCNQSSCTKQTNVGFEGGSWNVNVVAGMNPRNHDAYCRSW